MEDKTITARDKAFVHAPTEIWKVRQKKAYPDATNHIYLGKVIKQYATHIVMDCVTFHFDKNIDVTAQNKVVTGMRRVRRIPWSQIEVSHDISADFDYTKAEVETDEEGTVVFKHGEISCIITKRKDRLK